MVLGSGWGGGGLGWRVTITRVTAPSHASRRHASGSRGPAQPISPPVRLGVAQEAVQVHRHQQLRADPTHLRQSSGFQVRGGPARPGHQRCVGCRCGHPGRRPGGPGVPGRPGGSGRPRAPAARRRPPCPRRSGPATTRGGHGGAPGHDPRCRGRPPGAGAPGAAAADLGPAAGPPRPGPVRPRSVTWSGRGWVPWASTWAWATDSSPSHTAWAVCGQRAAEQGPGGPDRAGWPPRRSDAAGSAASQRSSRLPVPASAPAAPRASTPASSLQPLAVQPVQPAAAAPGPARPGPRQGAGPGPGRRARL